MNKDNSYTVIPEEFFEKSKTEEVMMNIAKNVKAYHNVRRGDPLLFEPDFVADGEQGIEMTIASYDVQNTTLVNKLRNNEYTTNDIEADTIIAIMTALERKAKKHYVLQKIDVVVYDILPCSPWYESVENFNSACRLCNRNAMYRSIFDSYLLTNVFTNVYIIMTGDYGEIVVFDVKAHEQNGKHIYRLKIENDTANWPFTVSKKVYERLKKQKAIAQG